MAKKQNRRAVPEENRASADYYKLHTTAVEDLVNADESNSPEVSEKELNKYRSGPKIKLSDWAKAVLIKIWFPGSVCFFIFWGLGSYLTAPLDMMLVFAIVLGMVTDLLTNNVLRFFAKTEHQNDRWMMFPKKQYMTFILNILYAMVLLVCVSTLYNLINLAILAVSGGSDTVPLGVGPILFGIFYAGFDLLFIGMKNLMLSIVRDAKESAKKR